MNGPGKPDCPVCHGDGFVQIPPSDDESKAVHPPSYRRCKCVLHQDILENADRGMVGLARAPRVPSSPLLSYLDKDLWITAPEPWFRAHLRHVAIRQPPTWYFKVHSDLDLVTAWLASATLKGQEIKDPDLETASMEYLTLVDLATPPQLLIIRLGVKVARNVAAPEVFLEAIQHRSALRRPTWVWDQPRWRLADGHICYSSQAHESMVEWPHVVIDGDSVEASARSIAEQPYADFSLDAPVRMTLSPGCGAAQPVKPPPPRETKPRKKQRRESE